MLLHVPVYGVLFFSHDSQEQGKVLAIFRKMKLKVLALVFTLLCCAAIHDVNCANFTVSVLDGEDAMLPCILPPKLSENNTVYWNFGKKRVSEGENITIQSSEDRFSLYRPYNSDWYLHISPVEIGDEGIYQCHVGDAFISTAELVIESPPVVIGYADDKLYLQVCNTARVTLYCNVTGRPPPTIKWYKKMSKDKLKYLVLNTESIFIPDVGHSNAGIYLCQVSNKHGQTSMEFHISVVDLVEELNTAMVPQVPYQSALNPVLGSAICTGCMDEHTLYFHTFVVSMWTTRAFVHSLY